MNEEDKSNLENFIQCPFKCSFADEKNFGKDKIMTFTQFLPSTPYHMCVYLDDEHIGNVYLKPLIDYFKNKGEYNK